MEQYKVHFNNTFGTGSVISDSPEYGNQYIVRKTEGKLHYLEPVREEIHSPDDFKPETEFFKIYQMVMEDGGDLEWSNVQFNPPKELRYFVI